MKTMKRLLAMLLVLTLTLSNLPVAALASEFTEPEAQETLAQDSAAPSEEVIPEEAAEPAPEENTAEAPEETAEGAEETEAPEETLEVTVEEAEEAGVSAASEDLYSPAFTFHSGYPVSYYNKITEFEADPDEENTFYLRYYPAPWVDSGLADTVPGTFVVNDPETCTWELVFQNQYESVYKITLNDLGNERVANHGIGESWEFIVWHDGIVYWTQNNVQMQKQFNGAGHLFITNKDATDTAVTPPIVYPQDPEHPAYLTCHWLGNDGQGWYQHEGEDYDGFRVMPGQEVQLVFFLNYYHEGSYVKMPTYVKPVNGDLNLELIGSENAAPGQSATDYFYRITTNTWDQHIDLVAAQDENVGGVMAHTDRNELWVYNAPVISNQTCVTGNFLYDFTEGAENPMYVGFESDYWDVVKFVPEWGNLYLEDTQNPNIKRICLGDDALWGLGQGYDQYFAIRADVSASDGSWMTFYVNFAISPDPDTIPHYPYLSTTWLDNWGEGFFVGDEIVENYLNIMPGVQYSRVFVLNTWDEETQSYVATPVIPENDHGLEITPVDSSEIAENQEFGSGFAWIYNPGIWDTEVPLYVTLEDGSRVGGVNVGTYRQEICTYRSPEMSNDTYIAEYMADYNSDDNSFYIGLDSQWVSAHGEPYLYDEYYRNFYSFEYITDNLYKVTLTQDYLDWLVQNGGHDWFGGFSWDVEDNQGNVMTFGLPYGLHIYLDPDTMPHDPYLTCGWLEYDQGFYDPEQWHENEGFNICPGDEFNVIFFLNLWDENQQCYVAHPVPVSQLRCNGVNFAQVEDVREDAVNSHCYVSITAKTSYFGKETQLYVLHEGERIGWPITVDLHRVSFYTSADISYKNRVRDFVEIDPFAENAVYLGIHDQADMIATSVTLQDESQGMAQIQKISDTVYKIIPTQKAIDMTLGMYLAEIGIRVDFQHKENPDWTDWNEAWFTLSRMGLETDGAFNIDYEFYEILGDSYLRHYSTGEFDQWGNEITYGELTQLPEGLSYDYDSNTLTMENFHGESIGFLFRYFDYDTGTEFYNLPTDHLTIELIGENSLISQRGSAADFNGNLTVRFTGDGSLHIKSTNHPDQRNWEGHPYSYSALWIEEGALIFEDDVDVTVEIAGEALEGRWDENGCYIGEAPAYLVALNCYNTDIYLKDNATVTTVLPQGARHNGPTLPEDHEYVFWGDVNPGGYQGIGGFRLLHVSGGTLNTSDITVYRNWFENDISKPSTFMLVDGTVNIDAIGSHMEAVQREWDEETQQSVILGTYDALYYEGLFVEYGCQATISGGTLNVNVAPEMSYEEMPAFFSGINIWGADLTVSGGQVNVQPGYNGVMLSLQTAQMEEETRYPTTFTMTGGELNLDGLDDCRVDAIDVNPDSTFLLKGGTITADHADFRMGGKVTIDGGTLQGHTLDYYSDNAFEFNSGLISFHDQVSILMGDGEMNGGTLDLSGAVLDIFTGFHFNGGKINIVNEGEGIFWPGLIVRAYFAIGGDAQLYMKQNAIAPAVEVRGTFHQMNTAKVTIDHFSTVGEPAVMVTHNPEGEEFGTLLLNDGDFTINGLDGCHISGLRMESNCVADFAEGDIRLTNADVDFDGKVFLRENSFTMDGGRVFLVENTEMLLENADFRLETVLPEEERNPEDWYIAFLASNDTKVTVNGGSFTVDAKGYDCALDLCGDYLQTGGTVTVDSDSIGMAVKGVSQISGGELDITGYTGYQQNYIPEITENAKLIISGGKVNIKAQRIGLDIGSFGQISGGQVNIDVDGVIFEAPELNGDVIVGQGILVTGAEDPKLIISGGDVNVKLPSDYASYAATNLNGIYALGGKVEILGGKTNLQAVSAYTCETGDPADMLVLGENMTAYSLNTGSELIPLDCILYLNEDGEIVDPEDAVDIIYYGCFEEDNDISMGEGSVAYATNVLITEEKLDGITNLESDVLQLLPGKSATLTATASDPDAKLMWTLAEGDSAYVTLKVNKDNTATVTAKKNKQLREVTVTVSVQGSPAARSLTLEVLPAVSALQIMDVFGNRLTGTVTYFMGIGVNKLPLDAIAEPEDAFQEVTWKSSNTKYATVDENGVVDILVPGKTVTITATAADGSNKKATVKLKTVLPVHEIELPEFAVCAQGKTITLTPEIAPENATDKSLVWEIVDGKECATLSNGKLKGIAPGEVIVRVSAAWNPDIYRDCRVTVSPAVKQVDILHRGEIVTKDTLTLEMSTWGENTLALMAQNTPDGSAQEVTWKSSNVKAATVDENGVVTALEAGKTVTITATAVDGSGKKATVKIKTVQPMEEVTISGSDVAAAGKTVALSAEIYPANTTNKKLVWSIVEGSEYASISNGNLKVNKKIEDGATVTVRVEWAENTEDYEVADEWDVTLYATAATGVDIVDADGKSITGQQILTMSSFSENTLDLYATVKSDKAAQEVLWKSSNTNYATVDENGTVTVLVPDKPVTITATAADGSGKKDSVKVKGVQPMESLSLKEEMLNENGNLFVAGGKSLKLATAVEIYPAITSNKKLDWSVSRNSYNIKINASTGVLTTKKVTMPVTVTVTAVAKDLSGVFLEMDVTVYPATTKVSIRYKGAEVTGKQTLSLGAGSVITLTAGSEPRNAAGEYTWKSSNEKYATVDENGVVTLLDAVGKTVTITATAADGSGKKATAKIKITAAPPEEDAPVVPEAERALAEAEIRRAISLLIDRNTLADNQFPASSFVPMGMTDGNGGQFYQNAGNNSYPGYWDTSSAAYASNYAEAMAILSKYYEVDNQGKLVNFPELTYIYNEGAGHEMIAEQMAWDLAQAGITMKVKVMEWGPFLTTRMEGEYDFARNGWLSDYNDPISMLDMWTSYSGNNDVQFGKDAHADVAIYDLDLTPWGYNIHVENGTWAQTYDVLIGVIKACGDSSVRYQLMHLAEDMLMETGCIVPLYYYTDTYMLDNGVSGFGSSPLGLRFFHKTRVNGKNNQINVNLQAEADSLDPAMFSTMDAGSMISHLFSGLAKLAPDANGNYTRIVADCARELAKPVLNPNGTVTYTYTLKDGLTWSDGKPLTAHDFEFAWKRAASTELGAAYGYMFDHIVGYPDNLAVTATDDKTLTVTLVSNIPYWNELLTFGAFMPVREDVVADDYWAVSAENYISNGAYTMTAWEEGSGITLQKNGNYWDAANVTMNKICVISNGDIYRMWQNGTLQFADSEFENMENFSGEFVVASALGTYYANFNINFELLP